MRSLLPGCAGVYAGLQTIRPQSKPASGPQQPAQVPVLSCPRPRIDRLVAAGSLHAISHCTTSLTFGLWVLVGMGHLERGNLLRILFFFFKKRRPPQISPFPPAGPLSK